MVPADEAASTCSQLSLPSKASAQGYMKRKMSEGTALLHGATQVRRSPGNGTPLGSSEAFSSLLSNCAKLCVHVRTLRGAGDQP